MRPISIEQSTLTLARHFFAVALYALWVLFTHPRRIVVDEKPVYIKPGIEDWPILFLKCIRVVSCDERFRRVQALILLAVLDRVCGVHAFGMDGDPMVVRAIF